MNKKVGERTLILNHFKNEQKSWWTDTNLERIFKVNILRRENARRKEKEKGEHSLIFFSENK